MNELPGCGVCGSKPESPQTKVEGKPRLIPVDRKQMRMVPVDVERLIPEDHEARAIWDFVGSLDLAPYYRDIGSIEGDAGRPAYDPCVLVSIWVYAYAKGIGSAREIARRTEYDPAFQWLAGYGDNKLSHPLRASGSFIRNTSTSSLSRPSGS